ncbi:DsbA family protein [Ralstonia sp. TCR112]|uniref:DsbA family protein n=1 Tax=Ralstonia sp. TCR112 TaxID=2601730 RepID=UPI003965A804
MGAEGPGGDHLQTRVHVSACAVSRAAARHSVSHAPAHPFNPIKALRLTIAMGGSLDAVRAVFRHIWRDGNDVASPEGFAALCEAVGFAEGATAVEQPAVKDALRAHTDAAIALGVFGVPTLVHDGELFWGEDATDMFLQSLRAGWLSTPEAQRVSTLPVGIQRG